MEKLDKLQVAERFGQYYLKIDFKRSKNSNDPGILNIQPNQIEEFSISQDLNRLLPSFRLKVTDSEGFLTHYLPFDHKLSKMHVQLGRSISGGMENTTTFSFDVYRRFPTSDFTYDIDGLLAVNKLFSPRFIRGFSGTIKSTLEDVANELGLDEGEISVSLDYRKNIVQAGWPNGSLLLYLKKTLRGKTGEAAFYCFVKCEGLKSVLVFKSRIDFTKQITKYKLCIGSQVYYDDSSGELIYPIMEYKALDNYKLLGVMGCRKKEYAYFDFDSGLFKIDSVKIQGNAKKEEDYHSNVPYFLIDKEDDTVDQIALMNNGRSNDFDGDFRNQSIGCFHRGINDLSKLWVTTWGLENAHPGDVIEIVYLDPLIPAAEFGQMYRGHWMVERVVHLIGTGFFTRLLLTREGVGGGQYHNLLETSLAMMD